MKKRPDGRYKRNVYVGLDADGKKKYKAVYGKSLKDLNEAEFRLRQELHKDRDLLQDDAFSVWADAYLASIKSSHTEAEYKLQEGRAEAMKKYFGDRSIRQLRPADVQAFIDGLFERNPRTGKPTSKATLVKYKQQLERIFAYAIDSRVTDYNPAQRAKIPRDAPVKTRRALTAEERKRIEEFDHPAQLAMMLMLYSGLRRGEAGALLWDDIDLKNRTISVTKSMDYDAGVVKKPKNGRSRLVTIPKVLADFLAKQPHPGAHVVLSRAGKPMTETAWKRMIECYLNDWNVHYGYEDKESKCKPGGLPMLIEPFTYHCLRHTFCTLMYEAGVDVLVAKEQMGHADVKTTLAIYTHLSDAHKAQDIAKLDEMLSAPQEGQNTDR